MKAEGWYTRAGVVLLDSVLLLLVLNVALYAVQVVMRVREAHTPIQQYGSGKLQKAYPGWREEDVRTLLRETRRQDEYEFEPFTGFKERPLRGRFVNVSPAGFRFSKDQAPWPPRTETTNVFLFGGSTTFGVGLPDDETIASYLQEFAAKGHFSPPVAVYKLRPARVFQHPGTDPVSAVAQRRIRAPGGRVRGRCE